MYYVYVIENSHKELYFGYTNDLKRRLKEHTDKRVFSTKRDTWGLIYYEAYKSRADARRREKRIKDYGQAWRQLKLRILESRKHET